MFDCAIGAQSEQRNAVPTKAAPKKPSGCAHKNGAGAADEGIAQDCQRQAGRQAKSMSFMATASYEYPSQLGPPILYTVRYDVTMQRPDKLRVIIPGDGQASELYYNGKCMMPTRRRKTWSRWPMRQIASHFGGHEAGHSDFQVITDKGGIRNQFHHVIDSWRQQKPR
jgi:hypothetical protein